MGANLDLSKFWCWQKDCSDYGKKGAGNIVLKERYGKDNRALLKCRTCGHCFSETRGTPFFGLNTSMDEVCRTLAQIPEKGSIRGVARTSDHASNFLMTSKNVAQSIHRFLYSLLTTGTSSKKGFSTSMVFLRHRRIAESEESQIQFLFLTQT
jgi:hypothetical protein